MQRPDFLSKYLLDWDHINVVVGGSSALDSRFFTPEIEEAQVINFLRGYGFDPNDPISRAELFGNFQEAVQFIKRYFLKEGNPQDGVDLKIPNFIFMITDIKDLFLAATGNALNVTVEERLWAEVVLKVMHTIVHIDKDLRANYFPVVQTQVFDRFYKYIFRDENNQLYLGIKNTENKVKLIDFQTKAKKTRESVIIKLLHKVENVAEELFDRIGIRFVTENRFDVLRVVKFLIEQSIVIPHNVKPSRSVNSLIDMNHFRKSYAGNVKKALRGEFDEASFVQALEMSCQHPPELNSLSSQRNKHSSRAYKAIQFTCRQLIRYKNPFLSEFNSVRQLAKKAPDGDELAKKVLDLDMSLIARDIRFFYPYEIQIIDEESNRQNTEGEASHLEYKRAQLRSALKRIFKSLLELKRIDYSG